MKHNQLRLAIVPTVLVAAILAILAVTSAGASPAPKGGRQYQEVSLSKLLTKHVRKNNDAKKGTATISGQLFRYVYHGETLISDSARIVSLNHTSCRSIAFDLGYKGPGHLTATLFREGSSSVVTNLGNDQIGSLDASVQPGKAAIVKIAIKTSGSSSSDVFANGSASCYTPNGEA